MKKVTPPLVLAFVVSLLSALSAVVTIALGLWQPDQRWVVVLCTVIFLGLIVIGWLFHLATGGRISREEARRNRHFLAAATDSQASSWSGRRTAIGSYAIEVHLTEDFLTNLTNLCERLEHYRADSGEEIDFTEKAVKQLREKVVELISDHLFIETNHAAFHLLINHSRNAQAWKAVKRDFHDLRTHLRGQVERPLGDAIRRGREETTDLRDHRRRNAVHQSSLGAAQLVQGHFPALVQSVERLRDEARADLHNQL